MPAKAVNAVDQPYRAASKPTPIDPIESFDDVGGLARLLVTE